MHLLFIEDSHDLSTLFKAQIRRLKMGHTVNTAATKQEAMAAFEEEAFDLIFVDMALDGFPYRGLEILKEIKAQKPDQRVAILSSNDGGEIVNNCKENGAEFYMVKPFTFDGIKLVMEGNSEAIRAYRPDLSEGPIISFT